MSFCTNKLKIMTLFFHFSSKLSQNSPLYKYLFNIGWLVCDHLMLKNFGSYETTFVYMVITVVMVFGVFCNAGLIIYSYLCIRGNSECAGARNFYKGCSNIQLIRPVPYESRWQ
jgi:hypothetical protein